MSGAGPMCNVLRERPGLLCGLGWQDEPEPEAVLREQLDGVERAGGVSGFGSRPDSMKMGGLERSG